MTDNAGEARQLEKWPGEEPLAVEAGTTEAAEGGGALPAGAGAHAEAFAWAKHWGLSDEQSRQLEAALSRAAADDAAMWSRLARGELPGERVSDEIAATQERAGRALRESLGEYKALEFKFMRGRVDEADDDQAAGRSFQPPVSMSRPVEPG